MKAQELRIGNLVLDDYSGEMIVFGIVTNGINPRAELRKSEMLPAGSYHIDTLKPIPLTPEWLERAGALKEISKEGSRYAIYHMDYSYVLEPRSDFGFNNGGYFMGIRYDDWDADAITINRFAYLINGIQYVHQLQNLYFALTGQELELK